MPYLIDGHNLIAQLPDIALDDPNDEALLVERLKGFVAGNGKRCVVIFDRGLPGGKSTVLSTSRLQVIFASAHHTTADRLIQKRIRSIKDPKNWTLVSSDNEILATARAYGMKVIRASDFARQLQRAKKRQRPSIGEAEHIHLSEQEIDEWLKIFGDN